MNAILAFVQKSMQDLVRIPIGTELPMMNGFEKQTSQIHDTENMKNTREVSHRILTDGECE
jgi:hypothetical protein